MRLSDDYRPSHQVGAYALAEHGRLWRFADKASGPAGLGLTTEHALGPI